MFWRFRSRARDEQTDVARLVPVRAAIEKALAEAEREFNGLKTRLEDARVRAALMMGNDLEDAALQRDSVPLREIEDFFLIAERRLRGLDDQIATFRKLRDMVDGIGRPEA
ncbi:hypothetical protein ACFQU1_10520 [Chelatococcus sp. GCM10030263]|jgi:hypothetical protein|uniref:hypothetical protein n=1 Tax=Chelatococcus sp. GCM10030263 TaxID=3273387 RepID=UPI003605DBA2